MADAGIGEAAAASGAKGAADAGAGALGAGAAEGAGALASGAGALGADYGLGATALGVGSAGTGLTAGLGTGLTLADTAGLSTGLTAGLGSGLTLADTAGTGLGLTAGAGGAATAADAMGAFGTGSTMDAVNAAAAAGSSPWATFMNNLATPQGALKAASGGMNLVSGFDQYQMQRQRQAQQQQYAAQMQALMANPSSVQNLPGYNAGLQAVQRSMAAQGYQGSGNMASALAGYGGQQYQQQLSNLAALQGQSPSVGSAPTGLATMGAGLGSLAGLI